MEVDELRLAKVAKHLHDSIHERLLLVASDEDVQANMKSLLRDLDQFQPCPQLLDSTLSKYVHVIIEAYQQGGNTAGVTEVFYNLGKIVGAKKLVNNFPTNVALLSQLTNRFSSELHWHEQYFLLCWLTVLVLSPFQFDKFGMELKHMLFEIAREQLNGSGPLQSLGARLLGSIVIRSDCDDLWGDFLNVLNNEYETALPTLQKGLLLSLNVAQQKDSHGRSSQSYETLCAIMRTLMGTTTNVDLVSKILAKFMITVMKQDEDDWDTIETIIGWFQDSFKNKSTETRFTLARQYGKLVTRVDDCMGIDMMLETLDSSEELIQGESFETIDTDLLHSYLLCLAELLRLDFILPSDFPRVASILEKTFFFQQARITFIAGSNIRDASNYIAWSLAKYQKKQLQPQIVMDVFTNLLLVCCFDKDIMIRRSATGALQELVGRHGVQTWKYFYPENDTNAAKSIKTIEILDYVDLGSIEKSYLEIPGKLLQIFPDLKDAFVDFLAHNVYNVDTELVKQSSVALRTLVENDHEQQIENVLRKIAMRVGTESFNSFIALSELIPLLKNKGILEEILPVFHSKKINHHKDPPFVILAYLLLLDVLLDMGMEFTEELYDNVFDAIRLDNDETLQVLKRLATKMALSDSNWAKWYHYMKHKNINTSSSVSYLSCFIDRADEVVSLLGCEKTDANVKSHVLTSISEYLQLGKSLDDHVWTKCIDQLDDYSISEQGDVGSKVRLATLKLLEANLDRIPGSLKSLVELKLVRLSAEPIDRLRHEAVDLLQRIYSANEVDTTTRDHYEYFRSLLNLFEKYGLHSKETRLEFFRGYIFTAGALKATDSLITGSLGAFYEFYTVRDPSLQKEILLNLAALIKPEPSLAKKTDFVSQRLSKQILVGMQFYSRALLSNITVPDDFNMDGLYARVYNLHLSTKSLTRLSCAIKIFGFMYVSHGMEKPKNRLHWLSTNHPLVPVRTMATEELFMVYSEKLTQSGDEIYKHEMNILEKIITSG